MAANTATVTLTVDSAAVREALDRAETEIKRLRSLVYEHHAAGPGRPAGTICEVCLEKDPETRAIWGRK